MTNFYNANRTLGNKIRNVKDSQHPCISSLRADHDFGFQVNMTKHNYFSSRVYVKVYMTDFKPTCTSQRVYKPHDWHSTYINKEKVVN